MISKFVGAEETINARHPIFPPLTTLSAPSFVDFAELKMAEPYRGNKAKESSSSMRIISQL